MFGSVKFPLQEDALQREEKMKRKQRRIILSENKPILPALDKALWVLSFALPGLAILLDAFSVLRFGNSDVHLFLRNSSWSALIVWFVFGGCTLLLSAVQLIRAGCPGYKEYRYYFCDELPRNARMADYVQADPPRGAGRDPDLILYLKPEGVKTRKKYIIYIVSAAICGAVLAAYFLCIHGF